MTDSEKLKIAIDAIQSIAMYGTSRPREMGEGDDGDGHYKRIAHALICVAARVLKELSK